MRLSSLPSHPDCLLTHAGSFSRQFNGGYADVLVHVRDDRVRGTVQGFIFWGGASRRLFYDFEEITGVDLKRVPKSTSAATGRRPATAPPALPTKPAAVKLDFESAGFVAAKLVHALPGALFVQAPIEWTLAHPDLIDRLMQSRVIVAGPTALYALLLNIGSLLTEFRALQQADQILNDARELHRRMATFVAHLQGVGAGLANAVRAFNGAVGSWGSRVAPQLSRMGEQSGEGGIPILDAVDEAVRETPEAGLRVAG